ncbi:glutamate formiminotransferase [Platysternon megacephalum]|uniref:Glutamate formiminotransferase n=1 Tax=Platysternon megacephalum TaxID=55544 RepID=A0A4D9DNM3_9SAUR|nr:glutamate formiminotransferase [Platysternon megacephalum]
MPSEALPCFQLLRMGPACPGDDPNQDLHTFRPAGPYCTYRLGRRAEVCDVPLVSERNPGLVSRVHAEIHAERDPHSTAGEWRVCLVDCSTHGTYVNAVRVPRGRRLELSDGDLVTFGHPDPVPEGCALAPPPGDSEFCFLFQKVQVQPQDFAAITAPKAPWPLPCGFKPVLPGGNHRIRPLARPVGPSCPSRPKATLILSSIGSISKLKPQPLTFTLSRGPRSEPPARPGASRSRRKSAHTLLPELEDEVTRLDEEQWACEPDGYSCQSPLRRAPEGAGSGRAQPDARLKVQVTPSGKRRGRPRKHPLRDTCQVFSQTLLAAEPCAASRCHLPQDETVQWVQCDGCDAWFHVACVGCSYSAVQEADFRCGGCRT